MKLRTKLLPLVGVAAAATTLPLALTSCNKGEQMVDLLNYESKFAENKPTGEKTAVEAAKLYFGADNAADLIKDDILTMLGTDAYLAKIIEVYLPIILGYDNAEFDMITAEANINDLSVKPVEKSAKATISGNIHLKLVSKIYEADHKGEESHLIGIYTLETKHALLNMPYTLWFSNDVGPLATGLPWKDLVSGNNWQLTRSYSGKLSYTNNSEPEEYETASANFYKDTMPTEEEWKAEGSDKQIFDFICWNSNYLDEITIKK